MIIRWSVEALDDVDRLVDFASSYDQDRATLIERELAQSPKKLLDFPRRGSRLGQFDPREVREFRVASYLLRYELTRGGIFVLRVFHAREDRL